MPRGRPKKKVENSVETSHIETPKVEVPLSNIDSIFARHQQLLDLIQAMKNEGAEDVGKLEVILSRVNQEIAKL